MTTTGTRTQLALSATDAVGVIIGGAYAVAVTVLGLWAIAGSSYPLAFGMILNGDNRYPFPDPNVALVLALVTALGLGLIVIFVRTAMGSVTARYFAIGSLAVIVLAALLIAGLASNSRRCAYESYSETNHCMSATAAMLRDFALMSLPAVLAIGCLVFSRSEPATD